MIFREIAESKADPAPEALELLQWSVSHAAEGVAVELAGELDLSNAPALGNLLVTLVREKPARLTLDLTRLTFCDSSGIHCLMRASAEAAAVGCHLSAQHPSAAVLRVLEICGVDDILLDGWSEGPTATRR